MPATRPGPTAIVYPAFALASYSVIRSLGERGVPVIALNPAPHPHLKSRWAEGRLCPSFADAPLAFIDFVATLAADLPEDAVLYLMEDVFVYLVHKHRDRLPPNVRFPWLDAEALAMGLEKRAMFEAAERAGVPLPWTCYPTSVHELEALRDEIPFPCLIKPLVSRFSFGEGREAEAIEAFPRLFGGKCARADSFDMLRALVARAAAQAIPICVQELLEGPISDIYGVHLYADAHHEILGAVAGRKLRQVPGDFGTGTLCELVRDDEAIAAAARFVKELRFHGLAGIEFKRDARNGTLKLIEINPRGVHWLDLARVGGVDLPWLQHADLAGEPVRQAQTRFAGRWIDGKGDWSYLKRYSSAPESPFHVAPLPWLADIVGASPAVLNWRDPVPGLMGLIPEGLGRAYLQLKSHLRSRRAVPTT